MKFFNDLLKINFNLISIFLLIFVISFGTFYQMLRSGIFSTHDFHVFRQYEYNLCIEDGVFPCRWSPHSGWEYGEPVFNFYGQAAYWPGQIIHLFGLSILDSVKFSFIFSLVLSGFTMYLLALHLWKDKNAALLSSIFYMYAPYRAVDVWVRGALPEAMAFVLFPLVILYFDKYLQKRNFIDLLSFIFGFSLLIITHNLSLFMLGIILIPWTLIQLFRFKAWKAAPWLVLSGAWAGLLSAWYLLPVLFEQKYTWLSKITSNYYQFDLHWATLYQLLISRYWDYGGSLWGPDDRLSFSIGHLHWMVPTLVFVYFVWTLINKRLRRYGQLTVPTDFWIWFSLGWFALFLTHGKSNFIWQIVPGIKFIQFPWRWLSPAVFCFSLAVGASVLLVKSNKAKTILLTTLGIGVIALNVGFFKPDLWFVTTDQEQFSGNRWTEQTASSLYDYWPNYGNSVPQSSAPSLPVFIEGKGNVTEFIKFSHSARAQIEVASDEAMVEFPIVYFPDWKLEVNGQTQKLDLSEEYGQISLKLPKGNHKVELKFTNTPVRKVGNDLSLMALAVWVMAYVYVLRKSKN